MIIWNTKTLKQKIGSIIWNTSEILKIPLGKYAPKVFGLMMGSKPVKIEKP